MSLLNRARQELLRLRLSAQEALQPQPSRGQVEQVVREITQGQQRRKGTQGQEEYRYDEPSQGGWDHYQEDQQRQRQSQQGVTPQGQQPQGLIGGLLGGLGGGRFPIRDALASYIKSRAASPETQGEVKGDKRRNISLAD